MREYAGEGVEAAKHDGGLSYDIRMCPECRRLRRKCEELAEQIESIRLAEEISKVGPHLHVAPEVQIATLQVQRRIWLHRLREHQRVEEHRSAGAPKPPLSLS